MLLLCLADQANDHGVCWPGYGSITRRTGMTERYLRSCMKALEDRGYVRREYRPGHSTVYHLPTSYPHPLPVKPPYMESPPVYEAPTPYIQSPTTPVVESPLPPARRAPRTVIETSVEPSRKQKPLSGKPDVTHPEQWDFKKPPPAGAEAEYLIAFLNRISGRHYQAVEANLKLVRARLKEASVVDIKRVIAGKCEQWEGDPKMDEYMRPATLFNATNFAQYLGALPSENA